MRAFGVKSFKKSTKWKKVKLYFTFSANPYFFIAWRFERKISVNLQAIPAPYLEK